MHFEECLRTPRVHACQTSLHQNKPLFKFYFCTFWRTLENAVKLYPNYVNFWWLIIQLDGISLNPQGFYVSLLVSMFFCLSKDVFYTGRGLKCSYYYIATNSLSLLTRGPTKISSFAKIWPLVSFSSLLPCSIARLKCWSGYRWGKGKALLKPKNVKFLAKWNDWSNLGF